MSFSLTEEWSRLKLSGKDFVFFGFGFWFVFGFSLVFFFGLISLVFLVSF